MYADSMENLDLVLGSKRVQGQCHSFTADHVHSILHTLVHEVSIVHSCIW